MSGLDDLPAGTKCPPVEPPPTGGTDAPAARPETWLAHLLAPWRRRYRRALALTVLASVLVIPQAALIAWLGHVFFFAGDGSSALPLADHCPALVALAGLLLRAWLAQRARQSAFAVGEAVKADLRARLAAATLAKGPVWLRAQRMGALTELPLAHASTLDGYYGGYLPARAEIMVVPLAILVAVFASDWIAGLMLLVTAPLTPLFMVLVGWGAQAAGQRQLVALSRAGAHFADRLRGLDLIRVFGRGQQELAGIAEAADSLRNRTLQVLRIAFLSSTTLEFFASISVAMVAVYFGFAFLGMLDWTGTAPTLRTGLFCLLLAPEFYAPMRRLAAHYHDRANALAAVTEIERTLEGLPAPANAAQDNHAADPRPGAADASGLAVHGLTVRHADARTPVIRDLSFAVPPGTRLALTGASGSGKSTLLEALAGWLPAEHGRIEQAAQARVVLAGQRPWLFHGSLADNIALGDPAADATRLRAAAQAAGIDLFADTLPAGLDTIVGENGHGLSGGQARRVGLARALLRRPDILLLDEPTAFLDPDTEARLLDRLGDFVHDRIVIVATHSPAVVAWAGRELSLTATPEHHGGAGDD